MGEGRVDIAAVRSRLAGLAGRQYWQGLEELAETDEFMDYLRREFPRQAAVWDEAASADAGSSHGMTRRSFLKLLGASLALAGLAGCTANPARKIVPYVKAPDSNQIPGKSLYYTTAMTHAGYAMGLLVESNEGRPTKIEGNPDHPASLGATDTFAQAAILGLYDPARSTGPVSQGKTATLADFSKVFAAEVAAARGNGGQGVRILTEVTSSPTLIAQLASIQAAFPSAAWLQWEPAANDLADLGAQTAFGRPVNTVYRFDRADTILSLDSDFLQSHADTLRYSRDFIERRRIKSATGASMNRLYAVEGTPTLDRREGRPPAARALARRAGRRGRDCKRDRRAGPSGRRGARRRARWVRRRAGARPQGTRGGQHRHRGQPPAARGACPGPGHERGAGERRQDRALHRPDRRQAWQPDRWAARPGERDERGRGPAPADSGRQPGVHRSGRRGLQDRAAEGEDERSPRAVRRRDGRGQHLAHPGDPFPRALERRPGFRWDCEHRPAADRAAVSRRSLAARNPDPV